MNTNPKDTQPLTGGQKFPQDTRLRDFGWIIVFFIHLVLTAGLTVFAMVSTPNNNNTMLHDTPVPQDPFTIPMALALMGITFAACLILSSVWLQLLKMFPGPFIYISLLLPIVASIVGGAFCILNFLGDNNASWIAAAGGNGIVLLICVIYFFVIRVRIPFAIEMLRAVTSVIQKYPGTQAVAFVSVVVHFIFSCGYFFATYFCVNNLPQDFQYPAMIYLLFSFYWVSEVIKNVVHVTVSGVIATWYFLSGSQVGMPASPTSGALKRSLTTSFGSICLGSLIVAILKTLRAILSAAKGKKNLLALVLDCFLSCLERLIKYFNHYAFCQVAIYGKTYIEAAQSTWHLISSAGIEAILNDNIIAGVLTMSCLFVALLAAGIAGFLAYLFFNTSLFAFGIVAGFALAGFVIGFIIMSITSMVLDSGVVCTFVCFAEDREVLRNNNPELFQRLMETYNLWG